MRIQRGSELTGVDGREPRDGGDPVSGRQALVACDAQRGRLVQRTLRSGDERHAAADAKREAPRAANLLGERPADPFDGRHERPKAHRPAPQHESNPQ